MFFGTYTPRLDDKGRLFLPAKFRDELSEGLVVTRGQERCLYVWSMEEFGKLTERLREVPVTNKAARDYVRMLFAGASDEMGHSIPINPYYTEGFAEDILHGLTLSVERRRRNMAAMKKTLRAHSIHAWMANFLDAAGEIHADRD